MGWFNWLSPKKKQDFRAAVPLRGPMYQAQRSRERTFADHQGQRNRNARAQRNRNAQAQRNRNEANARMAAQLQSLENEETARQLHAANFATGPVNAAHFATGPVNAANFATRPVNAANFATGPVHGDFPEGYDPQMARIWDNHVDRAHARSYTRNTSKNFKLEDLPYGTATLANNVAGTDPFTLEHVTPEEAVYLQQNLVGGKVKQMYDWAGVKGLLQQSKTESPLTRKKFTAADVKRVRTQAVRSVLARMEE